MPVKIEPGTARAPARDARRRDAPPTAEVAKRNEAADGGDAPIPKATYSGVDIAIIVVGCVAAIAAARFAEPLLVPVVAGIVLSYTLRPLVSALERVHVPRLAGAGLVIVALVALISATAWALRDDVSEMVAELPSAARKLRIAAAESARDAPGAIANVKAAAEELDRAAAETTGKPASAAPPPPSGASSQFQTLIDQNSSKALIVLSELFIAVALAFFLLAAGDTFRRKVAKLAGASLARRRVTVEALNEIDEQISAYMMSLLTINCLVALATWGALAWWGLPNPGMWGLIVGILHVIPYAGTVVSIALVGGAAFLHAGNFVDAAAAAAIVGVIAAVIGMGLATWLQGRACRINAVAAFIGVMFFGWLWGGWGLLLGMPILGVLKSIADRVESLASISELLGE